MILLFFTALLAATIFPAQSEALLVVLITTSNHPVWALVIIASIGNILGSFINWCLGRYAEQFKNRRWFPVKEATLARAQTWYAKYGRWSLLFSWVPFIGDPITLAAGIMRERLVPFLILAGAAKTLRYVFVAYLTLTAAA